jgi:hypothetical protein
MIKKGDRVIFVNNESGYTLGRFNPMFGTEWFCEGVVFEGGGKDTIRVLWDNGQKNSYVQRDLKIVMSNYLEDILFEV